MTDDVLRLDGETLRVVTTRSGQHVDVRLSGELDMAYADHLRLSDDLDLTGVTDITVDLADLEFVDSTGVQELLHFRSLHIQAGRRVRFERPGPSVRRVIRVLGLEGLLEA